VWPLVRQYETTARVAGFIPPEGLPTWITAMRILCNTF
jgi:hypothetical protein